MSMLMPFYRDTGVILKKCCFIVVSLGEIFPDFKISIRGNHGYIWATAARRRRGGVMKRQILLSCRPFAAQKEQTKQV